MDGKEHPRDDDDEDGGMYKEKKITADRMSESERDDWKSERDRRRMKRREEERLKFSEARDDFSSRRKRITRGVIMSRFRTSGEWEEKAK